jgi:hypothetical protein
MKRLNSFLTLKFSYKQSPFHIGMGSMPLPRKFHEELNDTYCDLPSTFFLDEFAFKSHSHFQKWHLMKLRVKGLHAWIGFKNDFSMEGKDLFFLMWLQPTLSLSILVVRIGINRR